MPLKKESEERQKSSKEQPDTSQSPFQRFEDFARKLVIVPKEEIDHEEEKYERRKKRRQAKSKK